MTSFLFRNVNARNLLGVQEPMVHGVLELGAQELLVQELGALVSLAKEAYFDMYSEWNFGIK